ncbi:MAG: NAD(P)/FAD-dependent oxidoreductase [Actinomycetota bacterium]|nr:NAD(P)/FAD-dependent oxidoreductase [Actinomycetota bacterium]
MHDVVVAGGGPAGLAVAIGAARAGLDVVVCDRRMGVVDKACGEGLMPGALRALNRLDVDPPGHVIRGITYRQHATTARAPFRCGIGRGVRRTALHAAMRDALHAQGVPLLERTISTVEQHDEHVVAAGLRARYVVAADGLHSPLRAAMGLDVADTAQPRWGLRRHYALAPFSDFVEVTWADRSEAYVTPIAEDTVGIAILSSARGGFDAQITAFPELSARIAQAAPLSSVRGAGPLRQRVRRRVSGRVLFVGDAAGYIDALTGEGLAVALAAAEELVVCLARDRPDRYEAAWARVSRRSRWITSGLLWARRTPMLGTRVVPLAATAPRLFGAAVDRLAR